MQDPVKILLDQQILGGNISVTQERRFTRLATGELGKTEYRAEYLETMPTMWAAAYTFQRAIEQKSRRDIEEWLALFLLDYYGYLHLKPYEQTTLQQDYDRDLWLALSGTYPRPQEDALTSILLLHASSREETVVGGYYPGIFFFPSRGRARWQHDDILTPYLEGQTLSWRRGVEVLLQENRAKQQFFLRLRSIAGLLEPEAKKVLDSFITQEPVFRGLSKSGTLERLSDNPLEWPRPHYEPPPDPRDPEAIRQREALLRKRLLDSYPLQQPRNGGTTYYLVTGWPVLADWMNTGLDGLPAPNQYEKVSDTQIKVRYGPQEHLFTLGQQDRVVLLKDFFLAKDPYYCGVNKAVSQAQTGQIRNLHKHEIGYAAGDFRFLKADDLAICLAPLCGELLEHFPEILQAPERCLTPVIENATVNWELTLFGKKLVWPATPKYKPLHESALALWPPQVSSEWSLYVALASGADKNTYGRWYLVDEQGRLGGNCDTSEGEYINILPDPEKPEQGKPNRPRALLLRDTSGNERGVLFLAELKEPSQTGERASLAMDFGTSNSCFAYSLASSKPEPLVFELSPEMLWGEAPKHENPGVVPFKWGGKKGYFPSILLSRRAANFNGVRADKLQAQHLFAVDIPGLHKEMERDVFNGTFSKLWAPHFDLKWESEPEHPWRRAAFLGLTLLYAHAELFFRYQALAGRYVFTFPLAFTKPQREGFHEEAQQVAESIRQLCYGRQAATAQYIDYVDESTAIARAVFAKPNPAVVEVFIDIGGGTTDIAIRHGNEYPVLDSIKLAGKSFFIFAEQNFCATPEVAGNKEFRQHLGRLLFDLNDEQTTTDNIQFFRRNNLDLAAIYSLAINRLDDREFRNKETTILEQRMGWPSYQLYRTDLFFRHILTYALLQACAVVVDKKLSPQTLTSGIKLILSGNGWGLLLFAELPRAKSKLKSECLLLLELLKQRLLQAYDQDAADEERQRERACLEHLRISDIDLLNENNLSKAKTSVPVGALTGLEQGQIVTPEKKTYLGVTLREVRINNREAIDLRWCDRWGDEELKELLRQRLGVSERHIERLEIAAPASYERPLDHTLEIFTSLGGSGDRALPPEEWQKINSELCDGAVYVKGNQLMLAPLNYFVSRLLYPEDAEHFVLNRLAAINNTIK